MTNRTTDQHNAMHQHVRNYVQAHGVTTTRLIAEYVHSKEGVTPSTSTIAAILDELGYKAHKQPRFVWKHKGSHE